MRILVTGSRSWDDRDIVRDVLTDAVHQNLPAVIVHGACPSGADAIASWWVRQNSNLDITEEPHPADWDACGSDCPSYSHRRPRKPGDTTHPGVLPDYCPNAGPRRNKAMVALGADLCVAFFRKGAWNRGTANCASLARRAGIRVRPVIA